MLNNGKCSIMANYLQQLNILEDWLSENGHFPKSHPMISHTSTVVENHCLKLLRHILHQLQTVPCCWQRICRWHWKKSPQPAARTSFCLFPKSYKPTLISAGWLEEKRREIKFTRLKTLLHLCTNILICCYFISEKRRQEVGWILVRQVMQKQVRPFGHK